MNCCIPCSSLTHQSNCLGSKELKDGQGELQQKNRSHAMDWATPGNGMRRLLAANRDQIGILLMKRCLRCPWVSNYAERWIACKIANNEIAAYDATCNDKALQKTINVHCRQ